MPTVSRLPANPPPIDPLVALADRCVQCGLCLPACPTYGHDRLEAESARGRIALVRAWALGRIEATPAGDAHLDHCLACRSCEAVCPAGVQFGELLVQARSRQRVRRAAGIRQRLLEWLAARPRSLRAILGVYRVAYPVLPGALRPLPRPPRTPGAEMARRGAVALFTGCVAGPYEGSLRRALVRLTAALGQPLSAPAGPGCCGALHAHAGNLRARDRLAARNRTAFAGATTVLTLASGCHESLAQSLAGVATTQDAIAWLEARADALAFQPCRERVALHLPCTQRNVVRSVAALRGLLARVPGLEVVELTAGDGCCGAAGTHMLVAPARAADYRRPLLEQFERSGATRLLSANIGCRLHFANATARPVQHPLEFLADCLAPADAAP